MPAEPTGEHGTLDVPTNAQEIINRVAVVDPAGVLLDDWSGVQFRRHVVARGTDKLHTPFERLVVGPSTGERRQEAVVDVDDTAGVAGTDIGREDLHVAGQDHHVGSSSVEMGHNLGEGLGAAPGDDRHVEKVDPVPLDERAEVGVVGDDGGDVTGQVAVAPTMQEVGQTVVLLD